MKITMENSRLINFIQIKEFLQGTAFVDFSLICRKEKYAFIKETFDLFKYTALKKKHKGLVRNYIKKITPESLKTIASCMSDNDYAAIMLEKKDILFNKVGLDPVGF